MSSERYLITKGLLDQLADHIAEVCDIDNPMTLEQMAQAMPPCASPFSAVIDGTVTSIYATCTFIGENALTGCGSLVSASFPNCSVVYRGCFMSCSALTTVSVPACKVLAYGAFGDCTALSEISLPCCSSIGSYAFSGCTNLASVYLTGSSVCSAGSNAIPYGSVYVPASLYSYYITANNWSSISSRIVSVSGS